MQKQTKRERNYYPFQSTNICLIYICTHECYSMWLHTTLLEVSTWCGCQSYTKWTLRVFAPCLQIPSPSSSITHINRDERLGGSVGWALRTPAPAVRLPAPATPPCLIYKPRSSLCLWCLPDAHFFLHTTWTGWTDPWPWSAPAVAPSLKRYWRKEKCSLNLLNPGTCVKTLIFEWTDPPTRSNQRLERDVVQLGSNTLACELLFLAFFFF